MHRLKAKVAYKGMIDGKLVSLKANEEFLCSPAMALELIKHYNSRFDVVGVEEIKPKAKPQPKKEKKEFNVESNKAVLDYENK